MSETSPKRIIIIAGPNGAGKTTFAEKYLPNEAGFLLFANADMIASRISPAKPSAAAVRAGRLMLEEINMHTQAGLSFAFETTLAGQSYARMIRRWRAEEYWVHLVFLKLDSPETAIERVALRVSRGGHDVPADTIRRRFKAGWRNFNSTYRRLVDSWQLYDNSNDELRLLDSESIS